MMKLLLLNTPRRGRQCRTCGEPLKRGYFHKHASPLARVLASIEAERARVRA